MPLSIKLDILCRNAFAEKGKGILIYGNFKINHDYFDHFCAMLKMLKTLLISIVYHFLFLPVRLNLCAGHQTGFGIQVQKVFGE